MHLLSIYISAIPSPVAPVGRRRALTCRRQVVFREPTSIGATGCNRTDATGRQTNGKRMANGEPTAVTGYKKRTT